MDQRDHLVPQAHLDLLETQVRQDPQVLRVPQVSPGPLEPLDQQAPPGPQVLLEPLVPLDPLAPVDQLELLVQQGLPVRFFSFF